MFFFFTLFYFILFFHGLLIIIFHLILTETRPKNATSAVRPLRKYWLFLPSANFISAADDYFHSQKKTFWVKLSFIVALLYASQITS